MRRVHFYDFSNEGLMKNSKTKMTVLSPYKKTSSLVSLIYAEKTHRQWPVTLTRNKKSQLETWRQTSLTDIPISCLQQLPKTKQIFVPHWRPPPTLPISAPPAAQHCNWAATWAATCPGQAPAMPGKGCTSPPGLGGNTLKCPSTVLVLQDPQRG